MAKSREKKEEKNKESEPRETMRGRVAPARFENLRVNRYTQNHGSCLWSVVLVCVGKGGGRGRERTRREKERGGGKGGGICGGERNVYAYGVCSGISTFGEDTKVNRLAPSVLRRVETPVNETYAAHRPRLRVAVLEAARPGELGGHGGQ